MENINAIIEALRPEINGPRILIVEDNDVLREGIQILLETDGFTVDAARNGEDALEHMKSFSPDLILCDIAMPVMDGYSFHDALRQHSDWVAIPFIFLTARGSREDIFEGRKLGVDDYLVKPVNRQELVTTIRSRLSRSQEILTARLQQAYEASLIVLANAIELRDLYTRGHVERVMSFSLTIAQQIGWSASQLSYLKFGSILHDIGKIYIREDILRKPSNLDAAEWDEMKLHPILGAELVKNIPYLAPAIPVIRCHHERWDGTGYPDGLAGEDIPLAARIVAVADSLDAMTTARVYQKPVTPEDAYRKLVQGAGTRYDSFVVETLKTCWSEIQERMNQGR